MAFSIPAQWDTDAEIVGYITLISLDTTQGPVRVFLSEDDGFFDTLDGLRWYGGRAFEMGDIEAPINGTAPTVTLSFTYYLDPLNPPDQDLIEIVRQNGGVDAIRERWATFYIQPMIAYEDSFRPALGYFFFTRLQMMQIAFDISGPRRRTVSVVLETSNSMRARPPYGTYNTADASRRVGFHDPSFEFAPDDSFDEEPLFGL